MFWFLIFFSKNNLPDVTIHLIIAWPMEGFHWHVLGLGQFLISSGGKLGLKKPCVRLVYFWVSDAPKCLTFCQSILHLSNFQGFQHFLARKACG